MLSVSGRFSLFAMARRWQRRHLVTTESHLPAAEAALLNSSFAGRSKV
ncbi:MULTISPECIES: hypothetical protein [unclassified Streptomyces]